MIGVAVLALVLDAVIGWPDWLYRRISHPVVWVGALVSVLDRRLNGVDRGAPPHVVRFWGGVCVALTLGVVLGATVWTLALPWWVQGILAWPLVAARALDAHVCAVARPLGRGAVAGGQGMGATAPDLGAARAAVAMIVGRDMRQADAPAITRAALESLAENTSDGVVAPLFWAAVAGLPGIAAYKAINTMDSMIGHRSPRYRDFGTCAARLDDGVNLIPARMTGGLFVLASGWGGAGWGGAGGVSDRLSAAASRIASAWRVMWRDARRHRSPNAGWPEAAMAGALGIRLSGPRTYGERIADEPWINPEGRNPSPADLWRGIRLYRRAMILGGLLLCGIWAV